MLHAYSYTVGERLIGILRRTLYQLSVETMEVHGIDILQPLLHTVSFLLNFNFQIFYLLI